MEQLFNKMNNDQICCTIVESVVLLLNFGSNYPYNLGAQKRHSQETLRKYPSLNITKNVLDIFPATISILPVIQVCVRSWSPVDGLVIS